MSPLRCRCWRPFIAIPNAFVLGGLFADFPQFVSLVSLLFTSRPPYAREVVWSRPLNGHHASGSGVGKRLQSFFQNLGVLLVTVSLFASYHEAVIRGSLRIGVSCLLFITLLFP